MRTSHLLVIVLAFLIMVSILLLVEGDGDEEEDDSAWKGETIIGGIVGPEDIYDVSIQNSYTIVDPEALKVIEQGGSIYWDVEGPIIPTGTSIDPDSHSYTVRFGGPGYYVISANVSSLNGSYATFLIEVDVEPDSLSFELVEVGRYYNGTGDPRSGDLFVTMRITNSRGSDRAVYPGEFFIEMPAEGGTTGWIPCPVQITPINSQYIVVEGDGTSEVTLFFQLPYNTEVDQLHRTSDHPRGMVVLNLDYPGGVI